MHERFLIPDRREGLVSPEEAPLAGAYRLLCFSRWPVLLCSHDREALKALVEYSVGACIQESLLRVMYVAETPRGPCLIVGQFILYSSLY
jgi:hypothetical protein